MTPPVGRPTVVRSAAGRIAEGALSGGGGGGGGGSGDPVPAQDATVIYDMREGGNQDLQAAGLDTLSDVRSNLDNITFSGDPFDPYITDTFLGDGTRAFAFPVHHDAGEDSCKGNGTPPDGSQQNMEIIPNLGWDGAAWNQPGDTIYCQYKRLFGRTADDQHASALGNIDDWQVHHDQDNQGPGGRKWIVWKRDPDGSCADRIDILKTNEDGDIKHADSLTLDGLNEDGKTGGRIISGTDKILLGKGDLTSEITPWWPDAHVAQINTITWAITLESAADAQDGRLRFWVNGSKIVDEEGLATCADGLKNPTLGFPTWICPPQDQTEYMWDVVFWEGGHDLQ